MKTQSLFFALLIANSCCLVTQTLAQQNVFIDFDSRTSSGEHFYTTSERNEILTRMAEDYSPFNFTFTQSRPTSGDFSTVFVNDGPALGVAEQIDPRNLDRNDTASVELNSGATTSAQFVTLTANVASHELGHLLGLRHYDSFGPIGSGLDPDTVGANSAPVADAFLPIYPGPQDADETRFHIMETDDFFIEDSTDQFFSVRSAIKLAFIEQGTVIQESTALKNNLNTAQQFELSPMVVPNTIERGDRAGMGDFDVDAITITGSLTGNGPQDFFQFDGEAGDLMNVHVFSSVVRDAPNGFDTTLRVLDSNGNAVDYFGGPDGAFNDDEFESFDSILVDLVLPEDGVYFIQVGSFNGQETGDYELFVTRFNGVLEPSIMVDNIDFNAETQEVTLSWTSNLRGPFTILTGGAAELTALGNSGTGLLPITATTGVSSPTTFVVPAALQGEGRAFFQVIED